MAVSKPTKPKRKISLGWRGPAVFLLSLSGIICLIGFMLVHWTERQVLTTDNWVKIVAPLPKNDAVATALSTYSVNQLFNGIDLESKVAQALPDKASFLAQPLVDQLQTRVTNVTKKAIQSDQFQTIWIAANKTAHQRLMDSARGNTTPPPKTKTAFNLNLSPIKGVIQARLGSDSQSLFNGPDSAARNNNVSLKASVSAKLETFKKFVRTVDFLNSTLWLLALVCLMGAIVLTYSRRRLVLIISGTILVVALLQLIGVKALRPAIINHIQNQSFRPAVGFVYDSLTSSFRHSATLVTLLSLLIMVVTFFTQKKFLRRIKFIDQQLKSFKRSEFHGFVKTLRLNIRRFWIEIAGVIALSGLVLGAFVFDLDWQGVLRLSLATILAIELISLAAARAKVRQPRRAPM